MKKPETKKSANMFEVKRVKQFDSGNVIFDISINGVTIFGCRVLEGRKGDFIGFPQYKGSDGNYYRHAYFKFTEEEQKDIIKIIEDML